ncbi:MAG: hypothetical protein ACK5YD_03900, partial [Phenylobacterium sp.]
GMAAEAWDCAAQRLVDENQAVREIRADACERAGENASLASGADNDLRISTLSANNARLRAALIALHVAVEGDEAPEARVLESRIWDELRLSTERRRLSGALA